MNKQLLAITTLIVTLLMGSGCDSSSPTPLTPETTKSKVRFALDWTPNTNHTGIFVAKQQGWYEEAGIDLEILPYSDAGTPDTLVSLGRADFGISFAEAVVTDRVARLPIKSVAAIMQTNTSAVVTLAGSGLDRPSKLEGKRYAGFGSPYEEPVLTTVLKADGARTGEFENITTSEFGYQALVAGQTDFVWIFLGWEGLQASRDGVALNTFLLKEYGVPDYYTPVIIGSEKFLSENPDVARRFMAATARGYEYGVSEPQKAADLLIAAVPAGTFPDPSLPRESQAYLAPFYKADAPKWGVQTLEKWTAFPRFLAESGQLKDADGKVITALDLDYAAMFTNEFLP